jgi:transposase
MNADIYACIVGHLGVVAGIYDALGIGEAIDQALPKNRHHKLPHSIVVKAMILNTLAYNGQRLYLYTNFFKTVPVEHLLGKGVSAEDLTDDVIGRTLDAIHKYGATKLYNAIVNNIMQRHSLGSELIHVDTTNFSVHGKYEGDAPDSTDSIKITYGHAKDGRKDLKRFVLGLVANQIGIPLHTKAYDGNKSDKKTLMEMIKETQKSVNLDGKTIWTADSAMYTAENIQELGTDTLWITHAPETINEIKVLQNADIEMTHGKDPRYAFYVTELTYGGIPQRAVVVWSEEMQKRQEETFDRMIQTKTEEAKKELNKIGNVPFVCIPDAENRLSKWKSDHPLHRLKNEKILAKSIKIEKKRGRPRKGEPLETRYYIEAEVEIDNDSVLRKRQKLGRFVLASNKMDLDGETILANYKGQQKVEHGFRFLKDKSFHVAEIYLKKEERIESLAMIMVLALLIYAFGEWLLRKKLAETGMSVPNQIKKPTQKPTMRWVFQIFMGVTYTVLIEEGRVVKSIVHLTQEQVTILRLLGQDCEKYYGSQV